mgnify:CR=1 FL=1
MNLKKITYPSWLPINKRLRGLTPYGAPQIENVVRLNTNENPFGLSKKIVKSMQKNLNQTLENLNRYPDRDAIALRSKLAEYLNAESKSNNVKLDIENIWAANGSNEILQSLFLAFGDRGAIGFIPSYSMHPLIAQAVGAKFHLGKRDKEFNLDLKSSLLQIKKVKPALVFLTTPNNPTGQVLKISEIESLAKAAAKVKALLIVDEAYEEFSNELSATTLMQKNRNLVVVRTMSKAFSLAGARVGYLAAAKEVVDALQCIRLPYHLSSQTQSIALTALEYKNELLSQVQLLSKERDRVMAKLQGYGLKTIPSEANFVLFTGFAGESKKYFEKLLAQKVLARDVGLAGYLRVTIGKPAENDLFLKAVEKIQLELKP